MHLHVAPFGLERVPTHGDGLAVDVVVVIGAVGGATIELTDDAVIAIEERGAG